MRKLFFVISVVGSVFFMTACGLNEEENITPSIDEMVVAPAATDSPSPLATTQEGTLENVPAPTPYCHGRYDEIGSFCVYIENFSTNNDYIVVRPVEWIIPEDEKRIKELGLDVERDLVSGYYIKDWGFSSASSSRPRPAHQAARRCHPAGRSARRSAAQRPPRSAP